MGGDSSFMSILRISAFLAAAWAGTKVSSLIGVSSIVLEITTGVVLGPQVLGLIPHQYAECESKKYVECEALAEFHDGYGALSESLERTAHDGYCDMAAYSAGSATEYASYGECLVKQCEHHMSSECQKYPDVMTLIGHTGVAMMIFESGMHFDFGMARQVGPHAVVFATIGTILPLVTGALLSGVYGNPIAPDGLTAGTALAPTSCGIALRLLGEAGVLSLDFGQAIMTAAFVDDVFSLILFNIFSSAEGDISFSTFQGSLIGIAFMIFAVGLGMRFWPVALGDYLLPWAERKFSPMDPHDPPKIPEKDEALFAMMLVMLLVYACVTYLCGTHLWGCFIAGMSFACLDEEPGHSHHIWAKQTKRITSWMVRIFFSCTVAFSIPIGALLSLDSFWKGSIMGIGPCILTKVCCALFMGPPKFVIGWAMVGRAEFAYLIAQMGLAGGLITGELFSQVIWALLWATIFAPLVFRLVLNRFIKDHCIEVSPKNPKQNMLGDSKKFLGDEESQEGVAVADVDNFVLQLDTSPDLKASDGNGRSASPNLEALDTDKARDEGPWEEAASNTPPLPSSGKPVVTDSGQGGCCLLLKNAVV